MKFGGFVAALLLLAFSRPLWAQASGEVGSRTSQASAPGSSRQATQQPETSPKQELEEEHEPADPDTGKSTLSDETLGLLPNPYEPKGIKFALTYVGDVLGNPGGGLRQGAVYLGRFNAAVDVDLGKLAGFKGLSVHANVFQIHGTSSGLSREFIGNLLPVSSIEALATTRLYELWIEQKLWGDKLTIRAGQLAADAEFIASKYTDVFITSTFGWPGLMALNLPSGGPSPPLAAMGVRVKAELTDNIILLGAVFNGDPAGPGADDPQSRNRYGLNFRISDPTFVIGEVQYAYNQEKNSRGLPGTIRLGGWYHAGLFNDQRFAANGVSQADPNAAPSPAQLRGDYGVYSVFEQLLLKFPGGEETRGLGFFLRALGAPSDRNLVDAYVDAGFELIGPSESRAADKIGLGVAVARISSAARALDRDYGIVANNPRPIRDYEAIIALSYLAELRKGWTVQPTLQYVIHPGGGYVTAAGQPQSVANALVLGARTVVKF